jgi:CHAT domain-containing protein
MPKRIVYTRPDGGVSVCAPSLTALRYMTGGGGRWDGFPRGFLDRQIAKQSEECGERNAHRFVMAMQFGGCTDAEAYELMRDRFCAHLGTGIELWDVADVPKDRWFRDAWVRSHNGGPINIDLPKAKAIQFRKIIAHIDNRLTVDFPDYAALAIPAPLSVEEVQAQLGANEALVLFLGTPQLQPISEETFIWVVTKAAVRWVRSDLGSMALAREVQALRCGLDATAWDTESGSRCADVLNIPSEQTPNGSLPLPFDQARAHAPYTALFGKMEDMIRDKHLLIVPSGPLTQLPLQVLITAPSTSGSYRSTAWLARKHALTVLPAVSSLKALRRTANASRAAKSYLGVGNPLLDGPDSRYAGLAKQAREKQICTGNAPPKFARFFSARRGVGQIIKRSGLVDLAHVRSQTPLPETADELCAVARDLRVGAEDVLLGVRAGEADLKALSEQGTLASYRVLHFATHGALSGEITGGNEPGLILTPPGTATEREDGYLSASEITGLKLDADWVVLSACNTAAGGADNAEALSGLARAFFYAGARALLVSHWAVNSETAVKLITKAFKELAGDNNIGRAEALRRSMLTQIASGGANAHPANWAPFVVVGEGAR